MLASCAKDPLAVLDDQTAPSGSIQLRTDTIVSSRWDSALIQHFYDDILAIQARTPFYDAFYRQYGYFNWAGFKAFRDTEGGKVLTAPVRKDPCGLTTGQFFYYDSGSAERRIKFYSRAELETKIDQAVTLNDEEVLAYQTMALNDLRRTCGDELALNTARLDLMWADVGEPSSSFETCEGGTWENVCIYLQPDEEFEAGWLILQFHNRHFPGIPDRRYYDNMSFGELQNYWNNLNPEGNYNDLLTMQNLRDYYEAREELSLMGIGNGSMGMLVGYRAARLVRHCAFVYVPCWVDLVDYDLNVHTNISGGGPGQNPPPNSSDPPWQSQYDGLRICEGVDDIFEIGPHNLPPVHPPHCRDWLEYLQECALPNSGGIGAPESNYETTVMEWARLRYLNPEWFDAFIVDEDNCSYAQHMGCIRAIMEFEQAYPSLISDNRMRFGLLAALGGECGATTDDVLDAYWDIALESELAIAFAEDPAWMLEAIEEVYAPTVFYSAQNPMCPGMFEFTPLPDHPDKKTAGIRNVVCKAHVNGEDRFFEFSNIYIEADEVFPNCGNFTLSGIAAHAFNVGLVSAIERIERGDLFQSPHVAPDRREQYTIWVEIQKKMRMTHVACAAHHSGNELTMSLPNNARVLEYMTDNSTVFVLFSEAFNLRCN